MSKIENERATAAKDIHNNRDITRKRRRDEGSFSKITPLRQCFALFAHGQRTEKKMRRLKLSFFVATKAQSVTNK